MDANPGRADLASLRQHAVELGFSRLAVARAQRSPNADRFLAWLDAGRFGQMDYMARQVARRIDPRETVPSARSVIVLTLPYADDVDFPEESGVGGNTGGKIARYARGRDYHKVMTPRLRQLAREIEESGPWQAWYSVDTGPILERDWAAAAGIGWIGKNGLIIDRQQGSYFFLGVLVTDCEYPPDAPATDHCGSCTACVDACPTNALYDHHSVDAQRCISYLTIEHRGALPPEYEDQLHGWVFGCDICQEVCPFNTRAGRLQPEIHDDLQPRALPDDLAELATLDRPAFLAAFAGTSIMRAGVESLRRNAELNQRSESP